MRGHLVLPIAHSSQRRIERVFANRPNYAAHGRKHQFAAPRKPVKLAKDGDCLPGQGNAMLATHFRSRRRNGPSRRVKIKLLPARESKLAGARRKKRHEFQRSAGRGLTVEAVDGPEKPAKRFRLSDGRARGNHRPGKRTLEGKCRIIVRSGSRYRVTKNGPDG